MSAASAVRPTFNRSEVLETLLTFNAIVENQALLTPAELRLAIILVRRGAHRSDVSVSAKNWQDWTGLDPKSRELAIRGLQKKCFRVSGRGDKARFRFERGEWEQFARRADRSIRPHVEQKRVAPKPNQMIHPECRERGCFLTRQSEDSNLISIDDATPNRKPVSDFDPRNTYNHEESRGVKSLGTVATATESGETSTRQGDGTSREIPPLPNPGTSKPESTNPSTATHNRKPVSNSASCSPAENPQRRENASKASSSIHGQDHRGVILPEDWPLTMTAMSRVSITAGAKFLSRLVAAVQVKTPDIADQELSEAVRAATKKHQHSEGLWLETVPAAVENVRRERAKIVAEERANLIRAIESLPDDDPEKERLLREARSQT